MFDKDKIYSALSINPGDPLIPSWGKKKAVSKGELVETLFLHDKKASEFLERTPGTIRKYIQMLFPDLNLRGLSNRTWESWFLAFTDYKRCCKCQEVRLRELFSKDNLTPDKLKHECKLCIHSRTSTAEYKSRWSEYNKTRYQENLEYNRQWRRDYYQRNKDKYFANSAKRRAAQLQAIPRWADLKKIEQFYLDKPKGYNVDHMVPLQGETVCGLHVENNLQYLTEEANKSKGNKLLPEYSY